MPLRGIHQYRGRHYGRTTETGGRMNPFSYTRVRDISQAMREGAAGNVKFIAGGTNLLDLMKENVERPQRLIDINNLPLDGIEGTDEGRLRIGALVRNAD